MKSVLQISGSLDPILGGPSEVVSNSQESFTSAGVASTLVVFGVVREPYKADLVCPTVQDNHFGYFVKCPKEVRKRISQTESILFHGFYLFSLLFVLLLRRNSTLYIMPHGALEDYESRNSSIKKFIFRFLFKLLAKNVKIKFLVATQKETIGVRHLFPKAKIASVGLGINLHEIIIGHETKLNFPIKLICISRIAKKKRIDLVIKSLKLLPREQFHLTVLGDGDSTIMSNLRNLVEKLSLGCEVSFMGFVGGRRKYEILGNSDIFLLPSENENFAIAAAEAVASGIPVILSNNVAFSDFVSQASTGIIIDAITPEDISNAIIHLSENFACLAARDRLSWSSVIACWLTEMDI